MAHSGKWSSAAEASRTASMSRARLASSRAARRQARARSSPSAAATGTQRLTACQQKSIGQGIEQCQAAPSRVIGEGRAAHPQTASAQRVELCSRGVFEVLLGTLQHRRRDCERAVQGAEEITGAGEPINDLYGRRGCRWQRGQLHFQRRTKRFQDEPTQDWIGHSSGQGLFRCTVAAVSPRCWAAIQRRASR